MHGILLQDIFLQAGALNQTLGDVGQRMLDEITLEIPHVSFVTDMAFIMIMGAAVTLAFFRMRQPIIIGYLFAGMLLGPISPMWTWIFGGEAWPLGESILADINTLQLFSEMGVILLLFVIGIEFPIAKIKQIGAVVMGLGSLGLFATMGVLFYVAGLLGMGFMDSLFIAAALSISSTAVIVKVLEDAGRIRQHSSIVVLGILIVEDVIAVILISTLQSVALADTISVESLIVVGLVAAGLIGGTITVGTRIIPPLIDRVAATNNREILLLGVLGLCFGYALISNMVGLSAAIGAFLAGVLVAESKSASASKVITSPIKDMFVAVFFIATGALMDITMAGDFVWVAAALIAVAVFMKFGGNLLSSILFRQKKSTYIRTSTTLAAPRGEFSIIIVKAGVDLGAISAYLFPLVGFVTIISTFLAPFLINLGERLAKEDGDD